MTWSEFKQTVEAKGLRDDDEIEGIYYGGWSAGDVRVTIEEKDGRRIADIELD